MKAKAIIVAALALMAALPAAAKSEKRGVSENEFQFKAQMAALEPGISWFYSWGGSVGRYLVNDTPYEFVPMCWNGNYNADAIREYVKSHPEVKYLLGFNEPNFTAQANMTPAAAAAKWPEVQALARELNLKLVSPALNYSPNPPYTDPLKWMDEFVALVGEDAFDYVAVHAYGGFGVLKKLATDFHDRYGKDVWVTEFCYWPEEGNANSTVAPEVQIASMMETVEWLEKTPWIYRYAWFKAIGESNASKGPNYGLLIKGKAEDPRELSAQGKVYLYMSEFDAEVYHATGTVVPASEYIDQTNCLMDASACTTNPKPIEISRFNAGATLDYQFDVPAAGTYTLVLNVTGYGEPKRFDPAVAVYTVTADGEDGTKLAERRDITLPNSDDTYTEVSFDVTLSAGRQTLRLKDVNPYAPSGIRIATVALNDAAGVEDIAMGEDAAAAVDVVSLQGIVLRRGVEAVRATEGLPTGIYLVGGKKVIVK